MKQDTACSGREQKAIRNYIKQLFPEAKEREITASYTVSKGQQITTILDVQIKEWKSRKRDKLNKVQN